MSLKLTSPHIILIAQKNIDPTLGADFPALIRKIEALSPLGEDKIRSVISDNSGIHGYFDFTGNKIFIKKHIPTPKNFLPIINYMQDHPYEAHCAESLLFSVKHNGVSPAQSLVDRALAYFFFQNSINIILFPENTAGIDPTRTWFIANYTDPKNYRKHNFPEGTEILGFPYFYYEPQYLTEFRISSNIQTKLRLKIRQEWEHLY